MDDPGGSAKGPVRRKHALRGKLALALLSPLVFLGLLEAGLRIAGFRFDPAARYLAGGSRMELTTGDHYAPHPDLLWTLLPSTRIDAPGDGIVVRTNSLGLSGPLPLRERAPGEVRILCLGDSVTFGIGLRYAETWPNRLAEALRERPELAGREIRVVCGAVPGWSSLQGMRLLGRLEWWAPDVVVFWFGMNDAKEARLVPDSEVTLPDPSVARVVRSLRSLRVVQLLQAATARGEPSGDGTRVAPAEFRAAVERLLAGAESGGPRPIFVKYPECLDVTISQFRAVVTRAEELEMTRILAPPELVDPVNAAPRGTDLRGGKGMSEYGPAIIFGKEGLKAVADLDSVREHLAMLEALKERLDARLRELPEDSADAGELFGAAPYEEVFTDNCHLTPTGARLAAEALVPRVLRALGVESR